jgi:hypothetical protein
MEKANSNASKLNTSPHSLPQYTRRNLTYEQQSAAGNDAFTIKRYRISKRENFELVEEKSEAGGSLKLGNSLAPDAVELIVLQRK